MKLRTKISLFSGAVALTLLLVALGVVVWVIQDETKKAMEQRAATISEAVGRSFMGSLIGDRSADGDLNDALERIVRGDEDLVSIQIYDVRDTYVASFDTPALSATKTLVSNPILLSSGRKVGRADVIFQQDRVIQRMRKTLFLLLALFSVISTVGISAAYALSTTISNPVVRLTEAAARLGKGDTAARASVESSDEIGQLASQFNLMAETIEGAEAILKEDVENLSRLHEATGELARHLDPVDLRPKVCETFAKVGRSRRVALFLRTAPDEDTLYFAHGYGFREEAKEIRFSFGEGIAGRVASRGRRERLEDLSGEHPAFSEKEEGGKNGGSMIAFPLAIQGSVIGVVTLSCRESGGLYTERDEGILIALAEFSAIALQNAENYNRAIRDSLTNLYVKRYFQDRLTGEVSRFRRYGSALSLLMLDLDHFKDVNDTYGHQTGDRVLIHLARVIHRVVRQGTDIAARYGGEEFVIILVETDAAGARIVGERLRAAVEEYAFSGPSGRLPVTISVGAATARTGTPEEELIHEADQALYAAKRAGRNRAFHYQDLPG